MARDTRQAGRRRQRPAGQRAAVDGTPQVEFRGFVPPAEVPSILAGARALVVPSECYEGQPRSILEAYAAGVPVVAHRIGGLTEIVTDNETGLLVEPGNQREWGDAARRLLDDGEAERMGKEAHRLWKEHYSPERGLHLLEAVYKQVLASPGEPREEAR